MQTVSANKTKNTHIKDRKMKGPQTTKNDINRQSRFTKAHRK